MSDTQDTLPVKEILSVAGPFIKSIVDTFITPKLSALRSKFSLDVKKYYIPTEEHFSEYFYRVYKKVSIVNTLVFNNSQRLLKEIFIPLTLNFTTEREKRIKVEEYPAKLLGEFEKILITDTAGMGKSTLMKKFFLDIIDKKEGIPILLELRRLSKEKKIINEIHEQIDSISKDFDPKLLLELINEGGFIFILDGFDEVSLSDKEVVTKDIQNFISKASLNKFLITSRPENSLSSFGDFQQFTIAPLKKKEAFELLRKYDKQGSISTLLIKKLEEKDMSNIDEFLTNPLLVSLLFTAFEHKQVIPFKKYLFYRQVYDANFESHDLTKGDSYMHDKYSNLEIDDFHRVMRHIGFNCFKLQKIEFTKDELLSIIRDSKTFCIGLNFNESDFLKDLIITVPLFTQDGNYYRWAHKSLQEYFAAQFIYLDSKKLQSKILEKIYLSKEIQSFANLLDLYYDIDFKTFRNIILYHFLMDFKQYYNSTYLDYTSEISKNDILERKEIFFLRKVYIFKTIPVGKSEDFDDDKFKIMMDNAKREGIENIDEYMGVMIAPKMTNNLFCLHLEDPKKVLLSILHKKKNPLANYVNRKKDFTEKSLGISFSLKDEYQLVEITDNKKSEFNLPIHFKKISLLVSTASLNDFYINSKEALTQLNEIEKSLEIENDDNYLLSGM